MLDSFNCSKCNVDALQKILNNKFNLDIKGALSGTIHNIATLLFAITTLVLVMSVLVIAVRVFPITLLFVLTIVFACVSKFTDSDESVSDLWKKLKNFFKRK